MKYIAFLFFVLIFSGNFPIFPEKTWTEHLLEDCKCEPLRVKAIKKVIDYEGDGKNWIIFFQEGQIYLEEMK